MSVASGTKPPDTPSRQGPAGGRALADGALGLLKRFLTLREGSVIVVTAIALIYFSVGVSHFFTGSNFKNLLPYFAPYAIIAAGEVFVMILGEIDLSVGAMWLFTPFMWHTLHHAGIPIWPAVIVALLIATAVGAFNGFATAYIGIPSFVATLGTLFVFSGLTIVISHATQISTPGTSATHAGTFAKIWGAGTYSELIWALVIVGVLQVVLILTRWGLYTVAVGGNRFGAAEAGINTRLITVRNFMTCSLLAGIAGILEAVRTTTATPDPSSSNNFLFFSIASVIIGGTLMTGGEGTVVGALIGALFLGILQDGLILKGVSSNYLDLYLGLAILVAMVINVYVGRVRRGSGRGG
jgi:simple sugar transport system permease protein